MGRIVELWRDHWLSGLDLRATEPPVVLGGVANPVVEVKFPENPALGHPLMLAPRTWLPLAFAQRIFSPYTRSTAKVISTLRSDTITDRYSSQSGCSPAAAR